MALEVQIVKRFPDFCLDVNFQTEEEVFGVLGESGCGKSLTLKCIAGIETPDEGRIVLNDRVLFDSKKKINVPAKERKVGYLFQEYALFPNMTVEENIGIGVPKKDKGRKRELVNRYIEQFFLTGLEKKYPSMLSGGQKQRVAIARMMITEPEIILLDEPFSAIDSYLKWQIEQQLLEWLSGVSKTTLFVSHNRDEIYRLCERIGIIHKGKMEVCGEKKEIFHNPKTVSAAVLTGCKNIADCVWEEGQMVYIPLWNIRFRAPQEVDKSAVQSIGIRAHDVQMRVDEKGEAVVERRIEAPFDNIYVVRPRGKGKGTIRIEIPKSENQRFEVGINVSLHIPEEKILWLKKKI